MLDFKSSTETYINPVLSSISDDQNLLLIAFPVTDSQSITTFKKLWSKYDLPNKANGRPDKNTKKIESDIVGGCISLINLNLNSPYEAEILAEISIKTPRGLFFCPNSNELLVGSAFDVKRIRKGQIVGSIQNNLFNGIHSIKPSEKGIYIVSSSTDSIVELDQSYKSILWDWIGTENGYQLTKNGDIRMINRNADYSKLGDIGTSHHTTHINGIEEYDSEHVLATLFHQDQLIIIHKKTGRHEIVFRDLINPHAIHRYHDKFVISDTRGNRVLTLNTDFSIAKIITKNFNWVQDAIQFGDKLLVLNENEGHIEVFGKNLVHEQAISWDTSLRMSNCLYKISARNAKQVLYPKQ